MFCSECGKQVADDAKFCGECGAVQTTTEQTSNIKVEQAANRNKLQASVTSPGSGKSSRIGIFLLWTVIVVVALFALKYFQNQTETAQEGQSNQVESVSTQSTEEKTRLAGEAAKMKAESAASLQQQEADIAREKADAQERYKIAQAEELQRSKIRYTTIFACVDQYNAGRNHSLADMLISELSKPNGVYAAYMNTSAVSEICSSLGTSFNNLELLHQKGQLISSENGKESYIVDLSPNTTVGVIGR